VGRCFQDLLRECRGQPSQRVGGLRQANVAESMWPGNASTLRGDRVCDAWSAGSTARGRSGSQDAKFIDLQAFVVIKGATRLSLLNAVGAGDSPCLGRPHRLPVLSRHTGTVPTVQPCPSRAQLMPAESTRRQFRSSTQMCRRTSTTCSSNHFFYLVLIRPRGITRHLELFAVVRCWSCDAECGVQCSCCRARKYAPTAAVMRIKGNASRRRHSTTLH
jgi:hypothetical protein